MSDRLWEGHLEGRTQYAGQHQQTQIFVLNHHLLGSPCRDIQIYIDNNKKIKKLKAKMVENIYMPCAIVHITNCYKHSTVDQSKQNYKNY